MATPENPARMRWEMFALSFTALFLEMMVIRWVPSVVHLVAYYANLMLLSSFLGLGAGAMAAGRKWNLFGWFPVLLACQIGTLLLCRNAVLGSSAGEARFYQLAPATLRSDLDPSTEAKKPGRHVCTGGGMDDVAYHRRPVAELMGGDRQGTFGEQRVAIADLGIVENIVHGRRRPDDQALGLAPHEFREVLHLLQVDHELGSDQPAADIDEQVGSTRQDLRTLAVCRQQAEQLRP